MSQVIEEAKLITDFNNDPVCMLPPGFVLDDQRWEQIWTLHEQLKRYTNHAELHALFPEESSLQVPANNETDC